MDSLFEFTQIPSIAHEAIKKPLPAAAVVGVLTLLSWGTVSIRSNYLKWKAMGPGGAPYIVFGWTLQHVLDLTLGYDTSRLEYYDKPLDGIPAEAQELVQRSFLDDLPERKGPAIKALRSVYRSGRSLLGQSRR